MTPCVLITRESSEPLAGLLLARGLGPVHLPLVRLVSCQRSPPCDQPSVVLLTSAAAVRFAPELASWCGDATVVVVGRKTSAAARQAGIVPTRTGRSGGSAALSLLPPSQTPAVFVGASRPAPAVAQALVSGRLLHWAVYDRVDGPVDADLLELSDRIGGLGALDLVLLASPAAAAAWADCSSRSLATPVVAIGPTTAAAATRLGLHISAVAARPDLESLADAAQRVAGGRGLLN